MCKELEAGGHLKQLFATEAGLALYLVPNTTIYPGGIGIAIQIDRLAISGRNPLIRLAGSCYKTVQQCFTIPIRGLLGDIEAPTVAIGPKANSNAPWPGLDVTAQGKPGWFITR